MAGIELRGDVEAGLVGAHNLLLEVWHSVRTEHGDGAAAEAAAGHAGTVDAIDGKRGTDQEIEFGTAHFVVVLEAAVGFHHEAAHAGKVGAGAGIDEIGDARIFGNDVAGAASDDGGKVV